VIAQIVNNASTTYITGIVQTKMVPVPVLRYKEGDSPLQGDNTDTEKPQVIHFHNNFLT
jgi:hypothetical protein